MISSTILSKSHRINTKRLFAQLGASLFLDTLDSDIQVDVNNFSFYNLPNSLNDLGEIITLASNDFAINYQISRKLAYRFLTLYSCHYPTVAAVILDNSLFLPDEKLKIYKEALISIATTPLGLSYVISWQVASSIKSQFIDLNNYNILKHMPSRSQASFQNLMCFGPHLSISFGHLALLMESLIALDCTNTQIDPDTQSKPALKYYYLENSECAYDPLKIGNFSNFLNPDKQIQFENLETLSFISKLAPLATHTEGISTNIAMNLLDKSGVYTRTSRGSLEQRMFSKCRLFNEPRKDSAEYLLRKHVDQQVDSGNINLALVRFIDNCSNIVAIHSRDAYYSGKGQPWRDSTFDNYSLAIDFLISKGIGVIRLSRSAIEFDYHHQLFLDLSYGSFSLFDQLYVLRNSLFLIGTDSGISHWWHLYRKPTLFLNTSVLEPTGILDSCLISPKRPTLFNRDILELNSLSFSSIWPLHLINLMKTRELTQHEILADVSYFYSSFNQKSFDPPTLHNLYSNLKIECTNCHDSFITPNFYEYMLRLCSC